MLAASPSQEISIVIAMAAHAAGSASVGGANATQSAGFSRTILECGRKRKRLIFGEQRALAFLFEATVCVGRSARGRPVADASLVIRSVELRCIFLASSCAAH